MSQPQTGEELPAIPETRVVRIQRVVSALSEFEQDELNFALQAARINEIQSRLTEPKSTLNLALHTTLWSGSLFGLVGGLVCGLLTGLQFGWVAGLVAFSLQAIVGGVVFGLFMAAMMIGGLKLSMKGVSKNLSTSKSALFQVRQVELLITDAEAFELSKSMISSKRGWKVESVNKEEKSLRATTPPTWRSPGEIVGVQIYAAGDAQSVAKIYSKPLFTAMDFGKNAMNVAEMAKEIEDAGQVHHYLKMEP
ncbi:MAG: hypothetical protein IAF58_03980 [Leptolyngbya sp.]|nr:hypothetical protein [Candidatus Melainabacteria bacterium]